MVGRGRKATGKSSYCSGRGKSREWVRVVIVQTEVETG